MTTLPWDILARFAPEASRDDLIAEEAAAGQMIADLGKPADMPAHRRQHEAELRRSVLRQVIAVRWPVGYRLAGVVLEVGDIIPAEKARDIRPDREPYETVWLVTDRGTFRGEPLEDGSLVIDSRFDGELVIGGRVFDYSLPVS